MSDADRAPSPDQNDPTGHSREGSPTYHPGSPPSNNLKPHEPARLPANDEEAREQNRVGTVEQPRETEPNVPKQGMNPPTGAPD